MTNVSIRKAASTTVTSGLGFVTDTISIGTDLTKAASHFTTMWERQAAAATARGKEKAKYDLAIAATVAQAQFKAEYVSTQSKLKETLATHGKAGAVWADEAQAIIDSIKEA